MRGRGGSSAGPPRAATTSIGLDRRGLGDPPPRPPGPLNGGPRVGGASFFPAAHRALSAVCSPRCAAARASGGLNLCGLASELESGGEPRLDQLPRHCAEARVGDQVAGADEQVPDEGPRDAGLEQGTRGGETGAFGNAEVAGDLEQDRPSFALRDELFLLVGRGRQGVRERSQGPILALAELAQVLVEVLPLAGATLPER